MAGADTDLVCDLAARRGEAGERLSVWELGRAYELALDEAAGKRRRQGSYFTGRAIVGAIVGRTLEPILIPRRGDLDALLELRFLDPAMGCGAFLAVCLDALADAAGAPADVRVRRRLAATCLFGVDSDPTAAELARLAITRAIGDRDDDPPPGLADHLRWGDSLAADEGVPNVRWASDHPGGFDAVVGNPPYLQEARGNSELFRRLRRSPVVGEHCERMTDLFHLFLCLGMSLLREGGRLGMIVPDYWLTRTGAAKVRAHVLERRLEELVLFGDARMFADAPGHHSSILIVQASPPAPAGALAGARVTRILPDRDPLEQLADAAHDGDIVVHSLHGRFLVTDRAEATLLAELVRGDRFCLPRGCVTNGLQSYPDRIDGEGVFVLTGGEVEALHLEPAERALLQPFLRTSDIERFRPATPSGLQVLYIDTPARKLVEANAGGRYDRVRAHLERFADRMTSVAAPYGLHRPRRREFFEAKRRLVMPRKCDRPLVAPVDHPLYGDESSNFMVVPEGVSRDGLLGVLASSIGHFFFWHLKRQGSRLQLDTEVLLQLPLPAALRESGPILARLERAVRAARAAEGEALLRLEREIDEAVAALYGISMASCRPAAGRFTARGGGAGSPSGATV